MQAFETLWGWYLNQVEANGGFYILFVYYLGVVLTERALYVLSDEHRASWDERDAITNIVTSSSASVANALGLGLFYSVAYFAIYDHVAPFHLPDAWWAFVFAFVLRDFLYWLDHIISHKNGFFWAFHQTHHSSREMNLTVASRGHVLLPLFQPVYLTLPLLGVSITQAIAVTILGNLWGIFNHTRLVGRMGPLERWLCTPANHRVHHGTQAKYLDKNYGQTLLVWDRLFGTWQPEEEEPVYGLVKQMDRQNPINIQTEPILGLWRAVRSAPTLRGKLGYLWHPPGWSHDGRHERSRELYAAWAAEQDEARRSERDAPSAPLLSPAE